MTLLLIGARGPESRPIPGPILRECPVCLLTRRGAARNSRRAPTNSKLMFGMLARRRHQRCRYWQDYVRSRWQLCRRKLTCFSGMRKSPTTIAAAAKANPAALINSICDQRMSFLQGLPTWSTFGKGWTTVWLACARRPAYSTLGPLTPQGVRHVPFLAQLNTTYAIPSV